MDSLAGQVTALAAVIADYGLGTGAEEMPKTKGTVSEWVRVMMGWKEGIKIKVVRRVGSRVRRVVLGVRS